MRDGRISDGYHRVVDVRAGGVDSRLQRRRAHAQAKSTIIIADIASDPVLTGPVLTGPVLTGPVLKRTEARLERTGLPTGVALKKAGCRLTSCTSPAADARRRRPWMRLSP